MIGTLNPIDHPQAWDVVSLAGIDTPARCDVKGWKRQNKWDVKIGKGTAGATTTFVGKPPSKGSITFYAWTAAHFTAWDALLPLLQYDPSKKTKQALDIYHPALADIGVHSVVVDDDGIGAWEHEGGQLYSRSVAFLEWTQASKKSAVSTPTGSDSASTDPKTTPGTQPDPAVVALQQQAAGLLGQAQAAYS